MVMQHSIINDTIMSGATDVAREARGVPPVLYQELRIGHGGVRPMLQQL